MDQNITSHSTGGSDLRNFYPVSVPDGLLQAVTHISQRIGHEDFQHRLMDFLQSAMQIDHCTVFTFTGRGPGHLFTSGKMPLEEAEGLAQDYVSKYHGRDPNINKLSAGRKETGLAPIHPSIDTEYDEDYKQHIFIEHNLIDKVSTVDQVEEGSIYCSFYRMTGSEPFSDQDLKLLDTLLPLMTSFITCHYKLLRLTGEYNESEESDTARNLIQRVFRENIKPFDGLTGRESEICERILIGYTSTGISLDLGIAQSSVNTYRRRAYDKLGIATQNELFSLCIAALNRRRRPI